MADLRGFWKPGNASGWQQSKIEQNPKRKKPKNRQRPHPKKKPKSRKSEWARKSKAFYASDAWLRARYEALKTHGARCQCCGITPADGAVMHVDHIKPRYRFPELELTISNLQVLCSRCNQGKGAWDQTDWRDTDLGWQLDREFKQIIG
jgi:5-methylcytosine-specific restriction endonuclease McrA